MPWESIEGGRGRAAAGVTMSPSGIKGAVLRIGADLLAELGWAPGYRVDILRGTGDHAGWVRFVSNPGGAHLLSRRAGRTAKSCTVSFSPRRLGIRPPAETRVVDYLTDGITLEVRIA
jgi:hypothetical protein